MPKYYALKAGQDGLTIHKIKGAESFDDADEKARALLEGEGPDASIVWILDSETYTGLRRSIMEERTGSAPGAGKNSWDMGASKDEAAPAPAPERLPGRTSAQIQPAPQPSGQAKPVRTERVNRQNRGPKGQ